MQSLWSDEEAAQHSGDLGLRVYTSRLKTEVLNADMAELVAEICGPVFAKTTGAQVPLDGGNERVI